MQRFLRNYKHYKRLHEIMNIVLMASLEGVSTRVDGTLKLTFGTPELDAKECGKLFQYRRREVILMMSTGEINKSQQEAIDKAASELKTIAKGKTHSQRLRDVLWLLHQQEASIVDFQNYYAQRMEQLITHFKNKLND